MIHLSVSMIVKNEEKFLEECLNSVKSVADEIIVTDTGSTDNTIKIAEKFGAKVFNYHWNNDFSAARNFSLSHCSGNWVLYIDADERVDPGSLKELERIKKTSDKIGYFCTVKSLDGEVNRDNSMRYVRLFRKADGAQFRGRVHEQISGSLLELGMKLVNSSILINHLGYNIDDEGRKGKAGRNLILLEEEYGQNESGYLAFQLANTHIILENNEESKKFFEIAANSNDLSKNLKALSYSYLALMEHKVLNSENSIRFIEKSLSINSEVPFSNYLCSKIHFQRGDLIKAEEYCKKALQLNRKSSGTAKSDEMHIFMQDEEIVGFGLYISVQNQKGEFSFFLKEFQRIISSKDKKMGDAVVTSVTKLLSGTGIDSQEGKIISALINNYNSSFFYLLFENNVANLPEEFIKELFLLNKGELAPVNLYSRHLFDKGDTGGAIEVLEENYNIIRNDPPSLLYLISYYITVGMIEKAEERAIDMEERFAAMNQVTQVVKTLKEKIILLKKS